GEEVTLLIRAKGREQSGVLEFATEKSWVRPVLLELESIPPGLAEHPGLEAFCQTERTRSRTKERRCARKPLRATGFGHLCSAFSQYSKLKQATDLRRCHYLCET